MENFHAAYEEWRRRPLPPGAADDSVHELHADLVLAYSCVAESVIPFVELEQNEPARPDLPAELKQLADRANDLLDAAPPDLRSLLGEYAQYARLLDRVYSAFLVTCSAPDASSTFRPPFIVSDGGDLCTYDNLEVMYSDIEVVDAKAIQIFDAAGVPMQVVTERDDWHVDESAVDAAEPARLERLLRDYFSRLPADLNDFSVRARSSTIAR